MEMSNQKIKGPASYFPAIEKTYNKPISYWLELESWHKTKESSWI